MQNLLSGAYDIHLHTSPDVVERKLNDTEMAERAMQREMAGFVIKNHYMDTSVRAAALNASYPKLHVAGGITLNHSVGGINPDAVRQCACHGGRFVWFPTIDAWNWNAYYGKNIDGKIRIVQNGLLIPAVFDVLDVIKQHDMVLCTGHISYEEGIELIRTGRQYGINKMILTHADFPSVFTSVEQQIEFVQQGALIEHSSISLAMNKTPWDVMLDQIRSIGCCHIVLSSDLGQPENPYPDDSLNEFCHRLLSAGIFKTDLQVMLVENTENLLGQMRMKTS